MNANRHRELLRELNAVQQEAVTHFGHPLLILAGAGSGKTRVITHKIAYIIEQNLAPAHNILAVTFTNKAAKEMRERARQLTERAYDTRLCTFHSYGAYFLRRYASAIGLSPHFAIYDDNDSIALLSTLFPHDDKQTLKAVASKISRAKNYALTPNDDLQALDNDGNLAEYYRHYQRRLMEIGNIDFGDLILRPMQILTSNSDIRHREQARISALLIDEYQDTNRAQSLLVAALFHENMYLCAVGDDDQSIYGFRGADVEHIVNFSQRYPQAHIMRLEQNYRSTGNILRLASHVVNQNQKRHAKKLWTARGDGHLPILAYYESDYQEARAVVSRISADWRQVPTAILYRINAQSRHFENELLRSGISYQLVGSVRFYEREEIKDIISFLKAIMNGKDEISLRRIINKPTRGIGEQSVQKLIAYAKAHGGNLHSALENPPNSISKIAYSGCKTLSAIISNALTMLHADEQIDARAEQQSLAGLVGYIAEASHLKEMYTAEDTTHSTTKVANMLEFIDMATSYPATEQGLTELLQRIELESAVDNTVAENRVTLITMHNTKGLEYERVFIVGLQDGLFPHSDNLNQEKIEEERRLFYVAITRAQKTLFMSSYRTRNMFGKYIENTPSRFVHDLCEHNLVELENEWLAREYRMPTHLAHRIVPGTKQNNEQAPPAPARANTDNHSYSRTAHRSHADRHEQTAPRFTIGDYVSHNDYGSGEIVQRKEEGRHTIVSVRFQSGQVAHFVEQYAALDRIAME